MISDEERREVARSLRYWTDDASNTIRDIPGAWTILRIEAGAKTWREVYLHLADLIEPSCDREALLALADRVEEDAEENAGCEDLVSAWYMADVLHDVAMEIREACGETL